LIRRTFGCTINLHFFHVDSVDEYYNYLSEKGVQFINEPHDRKDWGIRVAHFRDPDGNLIEINAPIAFEP